MKAFRGLTTEERVALVRPFVGRFVDITYGQFEKHTQRCFLAGITQNLTNGNSTGDVIIRPIDTRASWTFGGVPYEFLSIALTRIDDIREVTR